MFKTKRLKNLKLLKQKKLNKLTIEINTLNSEIKKSNGLKNIAVAQVLSINDFKLFFLQILTTFLISTISKV